MNETQVSRFPVYAKGIIGVLATCVSMATLGGNIVVLIAFFVESALRIPSNYFIASLAVTDILIGLISMNLFIMYQLLGYWPLGQTLCDIWLSLDFSACLTSQYTVFLITVDRYCSVKIPVSYRNWRTLVKVRWMICVSWLFPAGLFTPVILGWKQLTSEAPRGEGKCDVSFTYYPIFNTTLIVGYFWTTLVVMCSLYVGIYRVARRLQRKSLQTSEKLAELFNRIGSQDHEEDEKEAKDEDGACSSLQHTDHSYNRKHSSVMIPNNKSQTYAHDVTEPVGNHKDVKMRNDQYVRPESRISDENEGTTKTDDETRYSPLKTLDECVNLSVMRSPTTHGTEPDVDNAQSTSLSEPDEPPSITFVPECHVSENVVNHDELMSNVLGNHKQNETTSRGKTVRDNARKTSLIETFYCLCSESEDNATCNNGMRRKDSAADTSESERNLSAISVNKYVPSPKVPVPPTKMRCPESPKIFQTCERRIDSPVWVENIYFKKPLKYTCCCVECSQLLESSSSGYHCNKPMDWHLYPKRYFGNISLSPSRTDNLSDFSSSGQQGSSDQTHGPPLECICAYHASQLNADRMVYLSDYSESSSSYSDHVPWYKRAWFIVIYQCRSNMSDFRCHRCAGVPQFSQLKAACNSCWIQMLVVTNRRWNRFTNGIQRRLLTKKSESSMTGEALRNAVATDDDNKTNKKRNRLARNRGRSVRSSWGYIRSLSSMESHNRRHARKALRTITFILGAFIMCWIPYHIIMMIKGFCDDLSTQTSCVSTHLYNLTYWLCYMNSPINPFCYALSNALFRRTFFRILRGDFQKR